MGLPAPYISPDDVLQSVFLAIEEEMCTDSTFYVAAIVEYMRRYPHQTQLDLV